METDQHQSRSLAQAGNDARCTAHPQGVKLFPTDRFDHAVQLLEFETLVAPELRQIEGKKKLEHLGGSLANRQLGAHDCPVEGWADLNPHLSTVLPKPPPDLGSRSQWTDPGHPGRQQWPPCSPLSMPIAGA